MTSQGKKALIISNSVRRYLNGFNTMIEPLEKLGYDVTWAANFNDLIDDSEFSCGLKHIDINSNPLNPANKEAYKQIKRIMKEDQFDIVHVNTPIGSLLGRLAARKYDRTKVIYTAHGFHFYKGNHFIKNLVFKNGERFLSRYTDVLITINEEDFNSAKKFKLRNSDSKLYKVNGVGISRPNKSKLTIERKRSLIGDETITDSTKIIISLGTLNKNKNNTVIINSLSKLKNYDFRYILCGTGPLEDDLKKQVIDKGLSNHIMFLGYRMDVDELLSMSDIFVLPSLREGLSRSLMESMSYGLVPVVSKIRGNVDLVNEKNGFTLNASDEKGFEEALKKLLESQTLMDDLSLNALKSVEDYYEESVKEQINEIYINHFKKY